MCIFRLALWRDRLAGDRLLDGIAGVSWTPEQEDELRRLLANGLTHIAIGSRIGRSRKAIGKKLKRMGILGPTACRNGHPKTPESTYNDGRCRLCASERQKQWRLNLSDERREARNAAKRQPPRGTWRTDEALAYARASWERGITAAKIAVHIGNGCTKRAIQATARRQQWPASTWLSDSTWITAATERRARELWDAGYSSVQIAAIIGDGCTKDAILGMKRRRKWPAHTAQCRPAAAMISPSPMQIDSLNLLWRSQRALKDIRETVNALGPKQFTDKQLRHMARKLNLRRPSLRGTKLGLYDRPAKPPKPVGGPIPIPYREVRRLGADLELPLSKRGDIYAVSNAMKRAQPGHPGFVLADHQPTRLTWVS